MTRWRALLLALSLLPGLGAAEPVRVSVDQWSTLNPLLLSLDTDWEAVDLVFDRLVTMDAEGRFIPEMLESWTILDEGREVVLKLRPGLTWHDGRPIDAEDLVFTWNALRLPQVKKVGNLAGSLGTFDSLTAEGPLTARIRMNRPRGNLLAALYQFIPVPRRHYQVDPDPTKASVNFHPVGSGPYRVVGEATTRRLRLERWEGYRGPHPGQAPSLELVDPSEESIELPAFLAERLHFAPVSALRYYLVRKEAQGAGMVQAVSVPEASIQGYFLNCDPKRSLLGDPALRRAIAELVPWQDLARGRRFLPKRLAAGFWPPGTLAYDEKPHSLPSLERAAAILDAAGWKLGPNGLRQDGNGRPLKLVAYERAPATNQGLVVLLAARAAEVGMKIDVKVLPFTQLYEKAINHEGDIWTFTWVTSIDPDGDSTLFTLEGFHAKANVCSYLNPEVDRLFDQGRHTFDDERRRQIYLQISDIIYRDKPIIPAAYLQARVLIHRRLQGVGFNFLGQSFGFWPGRRGWRLAP